MAFLDGAYARLDRAREQLADLALRVKGLAPPHIEEIIAQTDFHIVKEFALGNSPGELPELPPILSVLIGEIIYNLRAALDYLVFDLAQFDSGKEQAGTQFPIDDSPEAFRSHQERFLKGVSPEHVARIERLEPYNNGYRTAMIRDISNPDKHRKLIAVDSKGVYCIKVIRSSRKDIDPKTGVVTVCSVEVTSAFVGHIAFKDDQNPVVETLNILEDHVTGILDDFKSNFNP